MNIGKEGEFSPALVVAASLDSGGGDMGGGSFRLDWCQGLALAVIRDIQLFSWMNGIHGERNNLWCRLIFVLGNAQPHKRDACKKQ